MGACLNTKLDKDNQRHRPLQNWIRPWGSVRKHPAFHWNILSFPTLSQFFPTPIQSMGNYKHRMRRLCILLTENSCMEHHEWKSPFAQNKISMVVGATYAENWEHGHLKAQGRTVSLTLFLMHCLNLNFLETESVICAHVLWNLKNETEWLLLDRDSQLNTWFNV